MKISDLPPPYLPRVRSKKSVKGGFSLSSSADTAETPDTKETSAPAFTGPLSSLMGLQEIEASTLSPQEWVNHGRKLLKTLDQLQLQWLEGHNTAATLSHIQEELERASGKASDESLQEIIGFIRQRVAVELEKAKKAPKD